ncbi:MAG: phosphate ABC transporter substrate-binding protein [Deltaproteobacteria bacterium]|nr:phosphate ABC transporter substrate-binding protein [Deltaproteobacteria bacterium]
MKKLLLLLGIWLLCFPTWQVSTAKAVEITIVGTGGGTSIIKALGHAFTGQNPAVKINVPRSIGSGGGIKAVGNGEYLLARVARKITPTERHYNLTYIPVARVPIVFYTNRNAAIKNLTSAEICAIYSGKIFNWRKVGGHDARIKVVRREDGDSSLRVLLKSFPRFRDITITKFSKTTYSDPETIDITEKNDDVIAFGDYSNVMNRRVVVLNINGISPTDPAYPYYGVSALVLKEKNRIGNIKKFIDFAISPAAAEVIKKAGGLPPLISIHEEHQ